MAAKSNDAYMRHSLSMSLTHLHVGDVTVIFKLIIQKINMGIKFDISHKWMLLHLTNEKTTLV